MEVVLIKITAKLSSNTKPSRLSNNKNKNNENKNISVVLKLWSAWQWVKWDKTEITGDFIR